MDKRADYKTDKSNDDDNFYDDRIFIEFNEKNVDFEDLITNIFPLFIKNFDAYTANILDQTLIFKDFEERRFGNRRKVISRIYTISFYDYLLCKSFFKRPPEKIVKLLNNHIYKAEPFNNGVLIRAGVTPFNMEKSIEFENSIKSILKY